MKVKEGVILCGGKGTRLRSVVSDRAKPVALVAGEPFLALLINNCIKAGVEHLILATGYKSETIEQYLTQWRKSLDITLSKEEQPLGTGGAVLNALSHISTSDFLLLNGDTYCDFELSTLSTVHNQNQCAMTMLVRHDNDCKEKGIVQFNKDFRITRFLEKSHALESGFINCGVYILNKAHLAKSGEEEVCSLEYDLFPKLLRNNCFCVVTESAMLDIGTPTTYQLAQELFA